MTLDPVWLAGFFGFDLIEYRRPAASLLIASGSGLMLALMDACPRFRWCLDIDTRRELGRRVPELLVAFDRNCGFDLIAIAGWFSIDAPSSLREGMARIKATPCIGYSGGAGALPGELPTLATFINAARAGAVPLTDLNAGAVP